MQKHCARIGVFGTVRRDGAILSKRCKACGGYFFGWQHKPCRRARQARYRIKLAFERYWRLVGLTDDAGVGVGIRAGGSDVRTDTGARTDVAVAELV